MKKKTYVIMVSRNFPANHPKVGEPTGFIDKIPIGLKRHTCRANYELWKKRIDQVNEGKAVLSLRYWSGSPYNYKHDGSKQIEFYRLEKEDGIGVQKLEFGRSEQGEYCIYLPVIERHRQYSSVLIAHNDGLTYPDFCDWFKSYDLSKPLAIIHFTRFRY